MNRSESKYFATADRMDEALLRLLEKKDLAYITVKEVCAAAGVNRSTFYLHYESMTDLLAESVGYMNDLFLIHMDKDAETFVAKLRTCPMSELYLVTPEYLTPYLNYIKKNRRLFRAAMNNAAALKLNENYERMLSHVFTPILDRYRVLDQDRGYIMAFYMQGLMAIISEWLEHDCADSIEHMMTVIQQCMMNDRREQYDIAGQGRKCG